jgi:hypothetical protein
LGFVWFWLGGVGVLFPLTLSDLVLVFGVVSVVVLGTSELVDSYRGRGSFLFSVRRLRRVGLVFLGFFFVAFFVEVLQAYGFL